MQSAQSFIEKINQIQASDSHLQILHAKINAGSDKEILSIEQLRAIYTYILEANLIEQIEALPINASIRLPKNNLGLPRTCVIQRFPDGHLELIVMTNRKFADGSKFEKTFDGVNKKDKNAYRLDDINAGFIRWLILKYELSTPGRTEPEMRAKRLAYIKEEAAVSQSIKSEFVSPIFIGSDYTHVTHGQVKDAIYALAKPGLYTLDRFMQRVKSEPEMQVYRQHPELLDSIVHSLLKGLADIHARQVIHTDIDARNIIVDHKADELICLYIDFAGAVDLTKKHSTKFGGTLSHASPEMSSAIVHRLLLENFSMWDSGIHLENPRTLAYDLVESNNKSTARYPNTTVFDFKDNSWSLGVILFELFTGVTPRANTYTFLVLEQNPLLKGLLAPTRASRFSAQQALECWIANHSFNPVTMSNDFYLQDKINSKQEEILSCISVKLPRLNLNTAILLAKECYSLSLEIKDPVLINSLLYKSPQILQADIDVLEAAMKQHMDSLTTRGPSIATAVCGNLIDTLSEQQSTAIKNVIQESLANYWEHMYGNNDQALVAAIQNKLEQFLRQSARYSCLWGCLSVRFVIDIPAFQAAVSSYISNVRHVADNVPEIILPSQAEPEQENTASTRPMLGG